MDLSTTYLGLKLPHPFISGAGPFADTVSNAKRVEDGGAAAIVMRSLFEEQLHDEQLATHTSTDAHAHSSGEALTYFPEPDEFVMGPDEYLEQIRSTKQALDIPVIASLNGYTLGGWLDYAKAIQQAGADAVELNLYYVATDRAESAADIEQRNLAMVKEVSHAVTIPVAIKLSPFYTALAHFARSLEDAGAAGLVLFNRFYEPNIDIEELEILMDLEFSDSKELLLRLRWLGILSAQLDSSTLAVSGGVHTAVDAVKAVMAGASAVQMVSALLRRGPNYISTVLLEMSAWMEVKEYASLESMRGSMNMNRCPDPQDLARGNYMRVLRTWSVH
ncbi:MAG: dihydroorotate dehydrogenase-like protein [Planctomycetota bacterium]|jgi:dihydroorotate dehydrogenase (fumarate)